METVVHRSPHRRESLHGPPGWTKDWGIADLLTPHRGGDRGSGSSFARFEGVTARTASLLEERLPEGNLDERQNGGPTCRSMLRATISAAGEVELSGYLVSQPRWDERVGLDGLVVHCAAPLTPGRSIGWNAPDDGEAHSGGVAGAGVAGGADSWHARGAHERRVRPRVVVGGTRGEIWRELNRILELGEDTEEPDELMPFLPQGRGGRLSWWLWWD